MRKKRNSRNFTFLSEGYIKKYFGTDIKRILVPSERSIQNSESPYVSHPEAESVLRDCLVGDDLKDKSLVFTGLTGSGKTTILRHVFGFGKNANQPRFSENSIIIPVDFNRSQVSAQDAILSSLRFAVKEICFRFKIDQPDLENKNFYNYILKKRGDFLELNSKHTSTTPYTEKMNTFLEKMPTTFASCQLQYVMDHSNCKLQLVVLVVDNIEAFMVLSSRNPVSRYLSPVVEAFKLADCIGQRDLPTKWCFNMVIACRHHIWRIMKGEFSDNIPENALLQSYITTELPYDLAYPVKVNDIIKKREEVFSRKKRDPQKWFVAVNVVNTVLKTMENNLGDFVLQIELKDLRKSMAKMQELILHRGLQKVSNEIIEKGAFQIDSIEQFDLTRVNIIRVIGLSNQKYYADKNSIIPNLLFNESKEGIELYPLLTLKYFLIACSFAEPTWDNPVSIPEFYAAMNEIFKSQYNAIKGFLKRSILFLIQHRLLLRSADEPQNEIPGLSLTEIDQIESVYVSGAAITLWNELGTSSALFQLFLDDVWLDEDSDFFSDDGNDIEHCVKYLRFLYQTEQKIYNTARNLSLNSAKYYLDDFGLDSVCNHLATGLISSLETIISSGNVRSLMRKNTAIHTLEEANKLLDKIQEWEHRRKNL